MPILGQIRSYNLSNVLVVRYFGGTKLGVSGLIKAYKTSAIENSGIIKEILKENIKIKFQYVIMNEVMKLIKNHDIEIKSQKQDLDCEMILSLPLAKLSEIRDKLSKIQGIQILEK